MLRGQDLLQELRRMVCEAANGCTDAGLLDFVYKLLLSIL